MAISSNALSGSGTLSSAGVGSGLDITGIVTKLMQIERAPIDRISGKTTIIEAQLTAYGTLQGTLSGFQTTVQTLTSTSTFNATKASVGDTTLFSAASDSTAAIGSYTILVDKLAKAQKLQSGAFTNVSDSVGTGTLTFEFGTYATSADDVTTFTENTDKKSVTVTIPSGSDSLSAVANAINAAKAGVSAAVINDGTSYYLSFSSSDPGVANSLRISVDDNDEADTDASGLSRLVYDKSSGYISGSQSYDDAVVVSDAAANNKFVITVDGSLTDTITIPDLAYTSDIVAAVQTAIDNSAVGAGKVFVELDANNHLLISSTGTGTTSSVSLSASGVNTGLTNLFGSTRTAEDMTRRLTETQTPQDAEIYIDGVHIVKSTNTLTDAISGVTLNLLEESATATTLTVASDTSAISTGLDSFVNEYNKASKLLSDLLAYDVSTDKAGALQSEGTVRTIQAQLRNALRTVAGGLGITSLSDVGVSFKKDGTLSFSSTKLNTALSAQTNDFSTFFIGTSTAPGIASRLDSLLESIIGSGGTLLARTDGLNSNISIYNKQKAALEIRMAAIENRYRKQFTDLDVLVASMNQTSSYLTRQLSQLPSLNGNDY